MSLVNPLQYPSWTCLACSLLYTYPSLSLIFLLIFKPKKEKKMAFRMSVNPQNFYPKFCICMCVHILSIKSIYWVLKDFLEWISTLLLAWVSPLVGHQLPPIPITRQLHWYLSSASNTTIQKQISILPSPLNLSLIHYWLSFWIPALHLVVQNINQGLIHSPSSLLSKSNQWWSPSVRPL